MAKRKRAPLRFGTSPADDDNQRNLLARIEDARAQVAPEPVASTAKRSGPKGVGRNEEAASEKAKVAKRAHEKPKPAPKAKPPGKSKPKADQKAGDRKYIAIRVRDQGEFGKELKELSEELGQGVEYCADALIKRARKTFLDNESAVQKHAKRLPELLAQDKRGGGLLSRPSVSVKDSDLDAWREIAQDTLGVHPDAKIVELVFMEELRRQIGLVRKK